MRLLRQPNASEQSDGIENRNGGASTTASPSRAASTGELSGDLEVLAVHAIKIREALRLCQS